jgi:hypothetical protein
MNNQSDERCRTLYDLIKDHRYLFHINKNGSSFRADFIHLFQYKNYYTYILKNIDRTDKAITYVPIGMISKIEKLSETVDIKLPHEMMDEIDKFL